MTLSLIVLLCRWDLTGFNGSPDRPRQASSTSSKTYQARCRQLLLIEKGPIFLADLELDEQPKVVLPPTVSPLKRPRRPFTALTAANADADFPPSKKARLGDGALADLKGKGKARPARIPRGLPPSSKPASSSSDSMDMA
jgi:hypothetical protein